MPIHLIPTNPLDLFLHLSLAGLLLLTLSTLLTTTLFRRSSAATRHLTWAATTLALLCLPAFAFLPPAQPDAPPYLAPLPRLAPLPPLQLETLPAADSPSPLPTSPSPHLPISSLLLPLYTLGLLPSLTPLLLGPLLLRRLRTRATAVTDESLLSILTDCRQTLSLSRPVTLLLSPSPTAMPLAFGLLRPHILLPADAPAWPPARLRLVLSHELAHIKRHDVLTLCLAQLARAVHWFNPLAYLAVSRMLTERERACDDLVLAATATRPSDYADTLLHLSTTLGTAPTLLPAMPMSRGPSHLHTRLRAILNPAVNRSPLTRRLTIAALLLALAIALPLSCSRSEKPQTNSTQPTAAETQPVAAPSDQQVDQYGWTHSTNEAGVNLRHIGQSILLYANEHQDLLPPTLGDTYDELDNLSPAKSAPYYLAPHDPTTVPARLNPGWVNQHTPYVYLGSPTIHLHDLPVTGSGSSATILAHEPLDRPHPYPKLGPVVVAVYADGHAQFLPVATAEKQIAASKQTLTAAAAAANGATPSTNAAAATNAAAPAANPNAPWPANVEECSRNLRDLASALIDYAGAHNRHYPPDLGPTVDLITRTTLRESANHRKPTAAELAHRYLCPLLAANVQIPDPVTPDWVRQHTTYTYLGSDKIALGGFTDDQWDHTVILHDDLDHPHKHPAFGTVTVVAYLNGSAELVPVDKARKQIEASKKTLAEVAQKSSRPETPSSNPQSAIPNPQSQHSLPFDLGDSSFLPGDSVTIEKVLDVTPATAGVNTHTYQVSGTYTLASRPVATLLAEVTTPDGKLTRTDIAQAQKGANIPFSLTFTGQGYPRVAFFSDGPFGAAYFGCGPFLNHNKGFSATDPDPIGNKEHVVVRTVGPAGQRFTATLNVDGKPVDFSGTTPAELPLDCRLISGTVTHVAPTASLWIDIASADNKRHTSFGVANATEFSYAAGACSSRALPPAAAAGPPPAQTPASGPAPSPPQSALPNPQSQRPFDRDSSFLQGDALTLTAPPVPQPPHPLTYGISHVATATDLTPPGAPWPPGYSPVGPIVTQP